MSCLIRYNPAGSILLPQGYTRLAYIESTGTLWIDTGYKVSGNGTLVVQGKVLATNTSGERDWIGNYNGTGFVTGLYNSSQYSYKKNNNSSGSIAQGTFNANQIYDHLAIYDALLLKLITNGATYTDPYTGNVASSQNITLFRRGDNNCYWIGRIYKATIWFNDLIVKDFVPVKRTTDNEIGMLDLCNNIFYGSLSDIFIAGPECPQGFPTSEYCLVEWLEGGTTSAYVDTGYKYSTFQVEYRGLFLSRTGTEASLVSCWSNSTRFFNLYNNRGTTVNFYDGSNGIQVSADWNIHTYKINRPDASNYSVYRDGVLVKTGTSSATSDATSFKIFARGDLNVNYSNGRSRCEYVKFYNANGTLQHHLVSCYRRSDMKPGFYDIINRIFIEGIGTTFSIGPSITFGWGEVVNGGCITGRNLLEGKTNLAGKRCDEETLIPINDSGYSDNASWSSILKVGKGGIFTLSFDAKADATNNAICFFYNNNSKLVQATHKKVDGGAWENVKDDGYHVFSITTSWVRHTITWEFTDTGEDAYKTLIVCRSKANSTNAGKNIYVRNVKLQYGEVYPGSFTTLHAIPHNISTGDGRNGEKNGAFHFDGTSYMEVDAGSILPANCTKYTIMMWAKVNTSEVCALFSQRNLVNTTARCVLYDNTKMYYDDGVRSNFSHGVTRNNWNHYAFVRNGSNKYVYVNGKLVNTNSANIAGAFSPVLTIGACLIIDSGVGYLFVGDMKDIKVFNTALTLAQIQQEM